MKWDSDKYYNHTSLSQGTHTGHSNNPTPTHIAHSLRSHRKCTPNRR